MALDPVTGLYNERARWYSPSLGTWISQDPLSYVNGANTYQFVGGNPAANRDPKGLTVVGVGITGTVDAGPMDLSGGASILSDSNTISLAITVGAGFVSGGGGGVNFDGIYSNAANNNAMGGVFSNYGGSGALDVGVNGEMFSGNGPNGLVPHSI